MAPFLIRSESIPRSIKIEAEFELPAHTDGCSVSYRRVESDFLRGHDGVLQQSVGQAADDSNILDLSLDTEDHAEYDRTLNLINSRGLGVFCLLDRKSTRLNSSH